MTGQLPIPDDSLRCCPRKYLDGGLLERVTGTGGGGLPWNVCLKFSTPSCGPAVYVQVSVAAVQVGWWVIIYKGYPLNGLLYSLSIPCLFLFFASSSFLVHTECVLYLRVSQLAFVCSLFLFFIY